MIDSSFDRQDDFFFQNLFLLGDFENCRQLRFFNYLRFDLIGKSSSRLRSPRIDNLDHAIVLGCQNRILTGQTRKVIAIVCCLQACTAERTVVLEVGATSFQEAPLECDPPPATLVRMTSRGLFVGDEQSVPRATDSISLRNVLAHQKPARIDRDAGRLGPLLPPEQAQRAWSSAEALALERLRQRSMVGSAPQVAHRLRRLAAELEVQELAIITWAHDPQVQARSYELLAREFSLSAEGQGQRASMPATA